MLVKNSPSVFRSTPSAPGVSLLPRVGGRLPLAPLARRTRRPVRFGPPRVEQRPVEPDALKAHLGGPAHLAVRRSAEILAEKNIKNRLSTFVLFWHP